VTRAARAVPPALVGISNERRRGSSKREQRPAGSPAAIAIGFRVKSGYAIAVALLGPSSAPGVVARRVVALSDPASPKTRQPYHDGFFKQENDPREIARLLKIVRRCAKRSVDALLKDACFAGLRCRRAGLVVGSVIDPKRVGNLHIRAHASEGQLFRTVLLDALQPHGITCDVTVEKTLAEKAVKGLRRTDAEIKHTILSLGKTLGGTWRAEEKTACTAAWLALT
jgi:hypothetical protein